MTQHEKDVMIEADGGGRGQSLISIILAVGLLLVLFLVFGRYLFGSEGENSQGGNAQTEAPTASR